MLYKVVVVPKWNTQARLGGHAEVFDVFPSPCANPTPKKHQEGGCEDEVLKRLFRSAGVARLSDGEGDVAVLDHVLDLSSHCVIVSKHPYSIHPSRPIAPPSNASALLSAPPTYSLIPQPQQTER